MVSRKHWLRTPLDIKGENIRLIVYVGSCLPSCYQEKPNQNRPKLLHRESVKVVYDRQSWWRLKRYKGRGSARAVQEWTGLITIAEKSSIIWKPALKIELKSHRSSTIIEDFFPYTRRNRWTFFGNRKDLMKTSLTCSLYIDAGFFTATLSNASTETHSLVLGNSH